MSCMTWWNRVWRRLHPGKQLASVGLGWKWIQILGFMFSDWLIEFHTLHVTVQDFFFFPGVPEDLRGFCAVPLMLGAVQCHCHAVWWAHTSPFCQFFVKSTPVLQALGTLRLVLLHQVSSTWIDKCVKERKPIFQWLVCIHFSSFLESNDGMWSCSPGYGIWEVLSLAQRSPMM